jgi:hypothetical protein
MTLATTMQQSLGASKVNLFVLVCFDFLFSLIFIQKLFFSCLGVFCYLFLKLCLLFTTKFMTL